LEPASEALDTVIRTTGNTVWWQGLERKVSVVHPLSGSRVQRVDLETGRLCVMASRHKAGLVVGRDHIRDTWRSTSPARGRGWDGQTAGHGHEQNLGIWRALLDADRAVGRRLRLPCNVL
jgi:hypothetical protein